MLQHKPMPMIRIALPIVAALAAFFCCLSAQVFAQKGSITITSNCANRDYCLNANSCTQGLVYYKLTATTSCTTSTYIDVSYKLDLNNDGSIEQQTFADSIKGNFPKGTHRVNWRVTDNCGNLATCQLIFSVKDCTAPTLTCINGLTQNLAFPDCITTFNASQFILVLSDNCTPNDQIQLGIRKTGDGTGFPNTPSITFDKCDVGLQTVEVWVKDGNGLLNTCGNYVIVQNTGNDCPCDKDSDIRASGCVTTPAGQRVSEYRLKSRLKPVSGITLPNDKTYAKTHSDSCFNINMYPQVPHGGSYTFSISADRNYAPLNGVSTYDLVLVSKHILGLEIMPSIYQLAAADVNRSNSVTTLDIVETRKLILGIYDTLPKAQSWRFVQPVANPINNTALETLKDTITANIPNSSLDVTVKDLNFVAIKSGDVNGNASANFNTPAEDRGKAPPLSIELPDPWITAGEMLQLPLRLKEPAELDGWQLALRFDPNLMNIVDVQGVLGENAHLTPNGELRVLAFDPTQKYGAADAALFTLIIKAKKAFQLSEALLLDESRWVCEGYAASERRPMLLQYSNGGHGAQFFAPTPNPSNDAVDFGLSLAAAAPITLRVFDVLGKMILEKTLQGEAGFQQLRVEKSELRKEKVLFYKISAAGESKTGRIVRNL